ncbi:MAG TPA: metal ABC transporter permease [Chlamydiales bacterium]|nr:metal ABC transporter permease [Chlamydiales bacterium]
MSLLDFFTDPVLRAPSWGTLFMCVASSLMGVLLFLQKKTLLSEALSHATYPGVCIAVMLLGIFAPSYESMSLIAVLVGALISAFLALKMIHVLQKKMAVDSALCFVLALFFGIGTVAVSFMQTILPTCTKRIQMLLFGQAATMTDIHIVLYGSLAVIVAFVLVSIFHPLRAVLFDREFSNSLGLRVNGVERIVFWLLLLSLILGIRSVGLVLMSGMVIAPAVAARQFTNHLHKMLVLGAFFGALSGVLGNILSVVGTIALSSETKTLTLPTGPMIVLVGGTIAFLSLLFAPGKGWVFRKLRIGSFRLRCIEENVLKCLWKKGALSKKELKYSFGHSLLLVLHSLKKHGWIQKEDGLFHLTIDGHRKASSIVRLHRLWELYLAKMLKVHSEKIHKTAEEMEHILTPDIEERLTQLLSNPAKDPHHQPIPEKV